METYFSLVVPVLCNEYRLHKMTLKLQHTKVMRSTMGARGDVEDGSALSRSSHNEEYDSSDEDEL
jgi:hypothetical protein